MHNRAVEAQQQVEQQLADEPRVIVSRAQRCMATQVSVQLAVPPQQARAAESSADAVLAFLREVDARLSRFRPESELCVLNRAAGGWFVASSLLFEAVVAALRAAHASGGLFDPALLPQLEALGYDRDFDLIARGESATGQPVGTFAPGAWRDIELEAGGRRIRLPHGLRLDLGGIAKGWAADVAIERLCAPFAHALVNVGGDLRLRGGPQPGASWTAGMRDPRRAPADVADVANGDAGPHVAVVAFSRGGLATSGAVRRWWRQGGIRRHHLLDPRSGLPAPLWIEAADGDELIATATALAPTAARAEVAAKVALLRGYPGALRAVEDAWARDGAVGAADADADAGVALALVMGSGAVELSANVAEWLATWGTEGAPLPANVTPGASAGATGRGDAGRGRDR
ncbi:MAG TPA: FAD:protein FMN transferase [Ktedonobacterales bacterium]|nr:FAD:protein FMN transferase [Ktedonobacterales bacterium]